jgi:hypothetical protein
MNVMPETAAVVAETPRGVPDLLAGTMGSLPLDRSRRDPRL